MLPVIVLTIIVMVLDNRSEELVGPGHSAGRGRTEFGWAGPEACALIFLHTQQKRKLFLAYYLKTSQFNSENCFVVMWKHSGLESSPFSVFNPVLWRDGLWLWLILCLSTLLGKLFIWIFAHLWIPRIVRKWIYTHAHLICREN